MKTNKFGKVIAETQIELAPYPLKVDGQDIFTDDPVIYLQYGWKQNIYTEQPPYEEGYYFVYRWNENETQNVRVWEKVKIEEKI